MTEQIHVLLVTLPDVAMQWRQRMTDMPPLGLAYLKTYLNKAGVSSKIINLFSQKPQRYLDMDTGVQQVCERQFKVLGVSAQDHDLYDVAEFCDRVKQHCPDIKIMVGGYVGFSYEELLKTSPAVDYVVVGEGEETVPELVKAILNGRDDGSMSEIKGIAYRKDNEAAFTGIRERLKDINDLLPPDLSDTPPYKIGPGTRHHVVASRGCFNKGCSFCSTEFMHPKYMVMSPEKVAEDIELIYKQYPDLWCIAIDDDAFDIQRLPPIMEELAKRGMKEVVFQFETTVPNILKNREILGTTAISKRIAEIHLGIESFNKEQLDEYNKRISPEENWEAVEFCHRVNIVLVPYIIIDRTPERLESTIPRLTHPIFWPNWEPPQPLMNHPFTAISSISRQNKREAPKVDNGLKETIERRCRPVWDTIGKPKYNIDALRMIQERQKKRSARLNVQPWQEAFCTMMGPWFGGAATMCEERERLRAMAKMNWDLESQAEKAMDLEKVKFYTKEIDRYNETAEAINALPEKFIRHALDVGKAVEMGIYDIYSTEFGDVVFAGQMLIQDEMNTLLEST